MRGRSALSLLAVVLARTATPSCSCLSHRDCEASRYCAAAPEKPSAGLSTQENTCAPIERCEENHDAVDSSCPSSSARHRAMEASGTQCSEYTSCHNCTKVGACSWCPGVGCLATTPNACPHSPAPCKCLSSDNIIDLGAGELVDLRGCSAVGGSLYVEGSNTIENLNELAAIEVFVEVYLVIANNHALGSLAALSNATGRFSSLVVQSNPLLVSLEGLQDVSEISGPLSINDNQRLESLKGLRGLKGAVGAIIITGNVALKSLDGLEGVTSITAWGEDSFGYPVSLRIAFNAELESITALDSVSGRLPGAFEIHGNPSLESFQGMFGIYDAGSAMTNEENTDDFSVWIDNNPNVCATKAEVQRLNDICSRSEYSNRQDSDVYEPTYTTHTVAVCPDNDNPIWHSDWCGAADENVPTSEIQLSPTQSYERTHSVCGAQVFCDYHGGGRCTCPEGRAGVGCTQEVPHVALRHRSIVITEPQSENAVFDIEVPITRDRNVEVTALEVVDERSLSSPPSLGVRGTRAAPSLASDIETCATVHREDVCITALAAAAAMSENTSHYKLFPPYDAVEWKAGEQWMYGSLKVRVQVNHNEVYEPEKRFALRLRHHSALYRDSVLTEPTLFEVVIKDGSPGRAMFARGGYRVSEDGDTAFVELVREGGSTGAMTVEVGVDGDATSASAGEDFVFDSAEITWKDGDATPKAIALPILDDEVYEAPDEAIVLRINEVTHVDMRGAELQSATVTIEDDCDAGTLRFESAAYTLREGEEAAHVRVLRSGGNSSAVGVRIVLTPVAGRGVEDVSFTEALRWDNGDGEAARVSVSVPLDGVVTDMTPMKFTLSMDGVTGGACLGAEAGAAVTVTEGDEAPFPVAAVVVPVLLVVAVFVVVYYRNDRSKRRKIQVVEKQKTKLADLNRKKSHEIQHLRKTLENAQDTIDKIVKEGGSYLSRFSLPHSSLEFETKIGEGAFGTVFKGTYQHHSGASDSSEPRPVAIKTVRVTTITESCMQSFMDEIKIMAPLEHENIVGLIGGCWEDGPDKLAIVLEYCPMGSLESVLHSGEQYSWETPFFGIVLGIAECFRYLHHGQKGRALLHRDLKTDNVLIATGFVAKVADFGASREYVDEGGRSGRSTELGVDPRSVPMEPRDVLDLTGHADDGAATMTMVGTPMYMAPEILVGEPYNKSVDVYSFGITVLQVAIGTSDPHYLRRQYQGVPRDAVCEGWRPDPPERVKKEMSAVWRLVRRCWKPHFNDRPDFNAICEYLTTIGRDAQSRHEHLNDTEDEASIKAYSDARRLKEAIKLLEERNITGPNAIEGLRAELALIVASRSGAESK